MGMLVDLVSWVLLLLGGFFVFVGGVGVLRMPELYTRMHASGVTDSIAPILVLLGLMLQAGFTLISVKLVAILIFLLLTGPTASNALASAALLAGTKEKDSQQDDKKD